MIKTKKDINQDLSGFAPIGLSELEQLNILNRYDSKYVFKHCLLPKLIEILKEHYNILEINSSRSFDYENLYFDTEDHELYSAHHNGKMNRYKLRYRKYKNTNTCFFEIKTKNNKSFTTKERVLSQDISSEINGEAQDLIKNNLDIDINSFKPQLRVTYSRITFIHKSTPEKVTIDTHLHFKNSIKEKDLPGIVIAEVKQNKLSLNSEFHRLIKKENLLAGNQIMPLSVSKYCTGTIYTHTNIKYNRFKRKIMVLNKLCD